jgi:hypothetical protein
MIRHNPGRQIAVASVPDIKQPPVSLWPRDALLDRPCTLTACAALCLGLLLSPPPGRPGPSHMPARPHKAKSGRRIQPEAHHQARALTYASDFFNKVLLGPISVSGDASYARILKY